IRLFAVATGGRGGRRALPLAPGEAKQDPGIRVKRRVVQRARVRIAQGRPDDHKYIPAVGQDSVLLVRPAGAGNAAIPRIGNHDKERGEKERRGDSARLRQMTREHFVSPSASAFERWPPGGRASAGGPPGDDVGEGYQGNVAKILSFLGRTPAL